MFSRRCTYGVLMPECSTMRPERHAERSGCFQVLCLPAPTRGSTSAQAAPPHPSSRGRYSTRTAASRTRPQICVRGGPFYYRTIARWSSSSLELARHSNIQAFTHPTLPVIPPPTPHRLISPLSLRANTRDTPGRRMRTSHMVISLPWRCCGRIASEDWPLG